MEPAVLELWARKKGIDLIATGDFTHPQYLAELKKHLAEDGSGFLCLRESERLRDSEIERLRKREVRFVLSGEISCIYKHNDKTRRVHLLILIPDFETADKICADLNACGCNLKSDGRPIIGLSAKRLAQICFDANEKSMVIPAHAWTPWFSVFGSKSGYDSLEECFEELTPKIFALETGLSSDPAMNWRLSALDNITLISNSDAHSPANIGREANVFEFENFTYEELYQTLKNKDREKFLYTIEFFPQEGKYHFDGHKNCKFVCSPEESVSKYKNICPVCNKQLVLGVDHRVIELADRELGFVPENEIPYKSLVPLQEIIAECLQNGKNGKKVNLIYEKMLERANEFEILIDLTREQIKNISNELIAEAIMRMREGKVVALPGYDGEYGIVKIFSEDELKKITPQQKNLF